MSVETLSVIISAAGLLVAMFSGFAWVIHRTDARTDRVEARLDERIHSVERTIGTRFDELTREVGEVKVAVARLEGPLPRLLSPR